MLLVGLTGGIGSGKSAVADLLAAHGAVVLDSDAVAREVTEPGGTVLPTLVERFGPGVVGAGGRLDREALARVVFDDPSAREDLEAITHPAIATELHRRTAELPDEAVVVWVVPLLVESSLARSWPFDAVVVVETPRALRLERLVRRGLAPVDAESRMAAQAGDEERRAVAAFVVDNAGDLEYLARQVDAVWRDLRARLDRRSGS